jgi:hypothetical protein
MNEARRKAQSAISKGKCVSLAGLPIGCGKTVDPNKEFKNELSRREYGISGLCQSCQDKFDDMFSD